MPARHGIITSVGDFLRETKTITEVWFREYDLSPWYRGQSRAAWSLRPSLYRLRDWTERFDNVIDSGLFHVFADDGRAQYVEGLKTVLKPEGRLFLLCFSDKTPGSDGPRRVTEGELRATFADGWQIESIESSRFEVRPEARARFEGGEPKAWLVIARRSA